MARTLTGIYLAWWGDANHFWALAYIYQSNIVALKCTSLDKNVHIALKCTSCLQNKHFFHKMNTFHHIIQLNQNTLHMVAVTRNNTASIEKTLFNFKHQNLLNVVILVRFWKKLYEPSFFFLFLLSSPDMSEDTL